MDYTRAFGNNKKKTLKISNKKKDDFFFIKCTSCKFQINK